MRAPIRRSRSWCWGLAALLLLVGAPVVQAAERIALVVGIGRYQPLPALPNPPNDASDMAAMLIAQGYDVDLQLDPTLEVLRAAAERFAERLSRGRLGLFYYAGHGVQVSGRNFLIPRDARIRRVQDLPDQALSLNEMLVAMQRTRRPAVVLLDACRDNPFRGLLGQDALDGLAEVNAGSGLLIGFATRPGGVALDGEGRNSPFTAALLRYLPDTRLDARGVLVRVRAEVVRATRGQQVPWDQSSLTAEVSLTGTWRLNTGLDVSAIPFIHRNVRQNLVRSYMVNADRAHAFLAVGRERGVACGVWSVADRDEGRRRTLQCCQHRNAGAPCFIYAEGAIPVAQVTPGQPLPVEDALPRQAGAPFRVEDVPFVSIERFRHELERFAAVPATRPKVLALHPSNRIGWAARRTIEESRRAALQHCNARAQNEGRVPECFVYAEGNRVVYDPQAARTQ
jgi:hypothetical protein